MIYKILPSDSRKFYRLSLAIMLTMTIAACAPIAKKQKPKSEDENMVASGLAILADGSVTDKSTAVAAFEQACNMGNNYGCHEVATAYNNGINGKDKNYEEAKRWYEKAAGNGYIPSQLNIANLYAYRLLPLNDKEGFDWLIKAGEGMRACRPGSIEADSSTSDLERRRLCVLAEGKFKQLLGIFRKRMTGPEMQQIEKSGLRDLDRVSE